MKDNNMNIQSSENILLIGAVFTKNFGGLLAKEMWAEIFNNEKIQTLPRIRELMSDDFDYESIYNSIKDDSNKYTDVEKEAFDYAVKFAYEYIDAILREFPQNPIEIYNVNEEIGRFRETTRKNYAFIFTLNQDLFFERHYNHASAKLSIPGIKNNSKWFTTYLYPLNREDYYQLPDEEELNRNKNILSDGNFFLIKLHGSYNWLSFDRTQKMAMVLGSGKIEQIRKEPLLKYYFEIFENVLLQNQRRLLIIGYGFNDEHINRIVSKAVRNKGLKIYIISPVSPDEFKKKLCEKSGLSMNIWQGVSGYFQYSLKEIIFSKDARKKTAIKQHFDDIFWTGLNKI